MKYDFDTLYKTYYNRLYKYTFNILKDEDDAFDVIQDIFIKLEHKVATIDSKKELTAFVYKISYNAAISKYRKNKIKNTLLWFTNHDDHEFRKEYSDGIENDEQKQKVQHLLERLDNKSKTVLYLKYFESMSSKEIATILKTTDNNVDVIHNRTLKLLRKEEQYEK